MGGLWRDLVHRSILGCYRYVSHYLSQWPHQLCRWRIDHSVRSVFDCRSCVLHLLCTWYSLLQSTVQPYKRKEDLYFSTISQQLSYYGDCIWIGWQLHICRKAEGDNYQEFLVGGGLDEAKPAAITILVLENYYDGDYYTRLLYRCICTSVFFGISISDFSKQDCSKVVNANAIDVWFRFDCLL